MGKCKFNDEWLEKTDDLGFKLHKWAKKGQNNDLICFACNVSIKVGKGFQAVTQHYERDKHKKNVKIKLNYSQCKLVIDHKNIVGEESISSTSTSESPIIPLTPVPKPESLQCEKSTTVSSVPPLQGILRFYSPRDSATRAEIIWTLVMLAKNFPAQSCQDISSIFNTLFPGCVPESFSLSPKKFSYVITDAIGPYFRQLILNEVKNDFFSIQFDETTNNKGKKELQICMKYWSNLKNEVVCHHLETSFMGCAKAEILSSHILSALNKASLSLKNLISIGCDGPAVNHKLFQKLNEEVIAVRGKSLLSVGTCNLHHVNNAFLKGLGAFGNDVSDLVISIYYFFHGWPSRQEDYSESQKHTKVPQHSFIKHLPTRWLTLKGAASRIIEQWPALLHYFVTFLPKKKATTMSSYLKIVSLLKKKTMKAELLFIVSSLEIFTRFSELFQKEEPLIHILQSEIDTLLLTLINRVCKRDCQIDNKVSKNAFDDENLLFSKEVECGQLVKEELLKLSEREQVEFKLGVQRHYVASGKYLMSKYDKMLKFFRCLQPSQILNKESCQFIANIAKALPGEINIDVLQDEWRLLRIDSNLSKLIPGQRIDHFWRDIFKITNSIGNEKFPTVKKVVKMCLCISHGSADVERGFSLSSRILTEERASMSERTLNARLNAMDGLRLFSNNPIEVPITKELLNLTQSAHKNYAQYCAEKKQKEELKKKNKEDERKRAAAEEENKTKVKRMKADIDAMNNDLNEAKKQYNIKKETREQLFVEGSQRLKTAMLKDDKKEISLAQAIIESVASLKDEEDKLQKKVSVLQSAIDKTTSNIITSFIKKL